MIGHLLTQRATVHRPATTPDEVGGQTVTLEAVGTVPVKVGQPSTEERMLGDQWGGRLTHVGHVAIGTDVERGDELELAGSSIGVRGRLRVLNVSTNSRESYLHLDLEVYQPEGG